ncbi:MAG: DASS family sodium-coupled anion symporter [Planctomycetota bacterium]|nr:DASS family sodium-coupled anion symporter [Planctomycetota bacterium]
MEDLEDLAAPTSRRTRVLTFAAALLLAAVGAWVAPTSWPSGPGVLEVGYQDLAAVQQPVAIGAGERITFERPLPGTVDRVVRVELPAGVATDAPVQARITLLVDGAPVRPALDDITLTLILSDGRRELVPPIRWDEEAGVLRAVRRPPLHAGIVLALLGLVIVFWVTEIIPLFITSLLVPVVIVIAGVGRAPEALAPFFHPIIALFFGGFLIAEAMRRVRLDHFIAVTLVARAGRSPALLFAALLATAAFLSMWMSNTAATAVLVPIAIAVTEPIANVGYRKACVLGIAFAATTGGVGSMIGTPANPLAAEFLATFADREMAFVDWFAFGLPFVVIFLPVVGIYLWRRSGASVDPQRFAEVRRAAQTERRALGRLTGEQMLVLGALLLVIVGWLTQRMHGISTGIVALAGAVLLGFLGKVGPRELQRVSWSSLLTFGGGLALGVFLGETGTSDWLATRMAALSMFTPWVGVAVVAAVSLGLTAVASNTASAALLIPLAIPLAGVLGVDPVLLVVVVAIASSIDFALVIGTPPTMIAYSTRLFTTREIFRMGILLDLMGIVLLITAVAGVWHLLGIVRVF